MLANRWVRLFWASYSKFKADSGYNIARSPWFITSTGGSRVCVEVGAKSEFPKVVKVQVRDFVFSVDMRGSL